jgi:hypothetical protein
MAGQEAPRRDSSAIAFLSQAASVASGGVDLGSIQDFAASGTITHFWGDSPKEGQLAVKSRGLSQFRLNSVLPEGIWSFIVDNGAGEIAFPNGRATAIAYHNHMNSGSLTWPILKVNAALQDHTATVIDMGLVRLGSGQAQQIRIQENFPSDPTGLFSKLTIRDYFFDSSSFLLLRVRDIEHPDNDAKNGALEHTVDFANYQAVNGMLVPFSISEKVGGQQTWQIQLSSITFNTGLSDSDFQF